MAGDNRLDDGFSTTLTFASAPTIKLWEKEVTPPGIDGGGPIVTTTMRNTEWRTKAAKKLKEMTDTGAVMAYAPVVYNTIKTMVNTNQLLTLTFPDGSKLQFWGYLNLFQPQSHTEGEQPTANVTIVATNQNASGVETAPVFVP